MVYYTNCFLRTLAALAGRFWLGQIQSQEREMAYIGGYAADDGSHRRQHRSMDRYAALASQNDAQEVQVWNTHNNHHAG